MGVFMTLSKIYDNFDEAFLQVYKSLTIFITDI